jgi:transposase
MARWKTATFLAALRNDRIDAPCLFDGPINGERFRAYIEQFLTPTLKPGDVVILDNLGSHKGKAVRKRSGMSEPASSSCRNTPPTSTPSSRSSPSSKLYCEKRKREPTKRSPTPAVKSSPRSPRRMRRIPQERRIRVDPKAGRLSYDFSRRRGEKEPLGEGGCPFVSGEGRIGSTLAV